MAEEGGALRELIAIFEVKSDTSQLKKGQSEVSEFVEKIKQFGEALIAAFAVEQIYEFTEGQVKAMTAIKRTADQIGISTDAVQGFQFAAQSLGLDADALTNSMGRLQVAQNAAANGTGAQGEAFAKLGVKIRDANGQLKSGDQLFVDTAEGISKITDPSKQAGAAVALFGRSGRVLLPILKKGKEGIGELLKEYKELGGGYGQDAIKQAEEFEEQSARNDLVLKNLKGTIASALIPIFTKLMQWVLKGLQWFKQLSETTTVLRVAFIAFSAVVAGLAAGLIIANLPVILMSLAFLQLAVIVDDLIALFTGEDSQIGEWIDEAFGKGQSAELVANLKDLWTGLSRTFTDDILPFLKEAAPLFEKIAQVSMAPLKAAQAVSGFIGDNLAKLKNVGDSAQDQYGDHTDEDNNRHQAQIRQSAQAYLAAQKTGGAGVSKYAGLTIPKGMTADEAAGQRDSYLSQLQSGQALSPGAYGPTAAGGQTQGGDSNMNTKIDIKVDAAPGSDPAAIGSAVADHVKATVDDSLREHKARLQTATP